MRFEWDDERDQANQRKHGISFEEASWVFDSGAELLEIYDEVSSVDEDRFIAIGPIERGIIVVAYTERDNDVTRIFSARMATPAERRRFEIHMRGIDE